MGAKGRASFEKRQKELARQQRAKEKAVKRVERVERRQGEKPERPGEVDPDIADIVPGPQPPPY